ncbi:MAG TPA: polymer-forming cytoskeletal protein [Desulfobacterales bacterium]|nr:polymer-forming cytoskeletal protein [Desulfobacterales bacterium]
MKNESENFSIIDKGLTVNGEISTDGKLIVKGTVKGKLTGETVIIAKEGSVQADTKVGTMTVGGKFEGEVRAMNELIILSTGNCSGKVACKDLVVEAGGILNAEVISLKIQDSKSGEEFSLSFG